MAAPAVARAPSTGPSQRQRAQTLLSASTSANISPSLSRSYHQPLGTGSLRRTQQQGSHVRSRSHGDAGASLSAVAKGKRRAVFCDVVVDDLELDENGVCVYPTGTSGGARGLHRRTDLLFLDRPRLRLPQLAWLAHHPTRTQLISAAAHTTHDARESPQSRLRQG